MSKRLDSYKNKICYKGTQYTLALSKLNKAKTIFFGVEDKNIFKIFFLIWDLGLPRATSNTIWNEKLCIKIFVAEMG